MSLGKMLNLGGIDNRPPKANQSQGRFRVARNVYPTPDGRIIPRYDNEPYDISPTNPLYAINYITEYDGVPFFVVTEFVSPYYIYAFYLGSTRIPTFGIGTLPPIAIDGIAESTYSFSSFRRNNTLYLTDAYSGITVKFDGVQVSKAGVQQPVISYASTGTRRVKAIYHTTDFDNNDVWSESINFASATAGTINVRIDGTLNIINSAYSTVTPTNVIRENESLGQLYFVGGTAAYNAGTLDYTISGSSNNLIFSTYVGSYIVVSPYLSTGGLGSITDPLYGLAMKIKSISPLKLDATNVKYLDENRVWKTVTAATTGLAPSITYGSNIFISFWKSSSATGVFYLDQFSAAFPGFSGASITSAVDLTNLISTSLTGNTFIVSMGPILNDIYDVNIRKLSSNAVYPFGSRETEVGTATHTNYSIACQTVFQDLLLLASDDLIWYSDTTLGGALEQLNTSAFIRIGDFEFGRITAICGTSDFLFVSRERKNYFVVGNITTGNYKVQEITEAEIGAWSNSAAVNVKDTVIFMTAIGVFQVQAGGRTTKLSDYCPKNFSTYDNVGVNEDVSFRLTGFTSDFTNTVQNGLSVAYDEFRELLVFSQRGVTTSPALVIHTKTGEIYEWDGLNNQGGTTKINCIGFVLGEYYYGTLSTTVALLADTNKEDKTFPLSYPTTYPVKLYSSWLTAGEPSLEKSLLQLKIFGRIQSREEISSINVCHYKDWDISTKITNVEYFPTLIGDLDDQIQYSHKQRLNSDKVLSSSVGIEINDLGILFEIESFEVEFNPIQSGMKK